MDFSKKQISKVKVCSQAKTVEKMHLSLAKLSSDSDCCKCLEALIIICMLVSSSITLAKTEIIYQRNFRAKVPMEFTQGKCSAPN